MSRRLVVATRSAGKLRELRSLLEEAGYEPLNLRAEDKARLKQYVEEGGLILANADCGTKAFADSFRKLGGELFSEYEFRELPAEHPIYTNEQFTRAKWKAKPAVLSLGNEVRELMILIPQADPAKAWQSKLRRRDDGDSRR